MKIRMKCSSCKQQYEIFMRHEIVSLSLSCLSCDNIISYKPQMRSGPIRKKDIAEFRKAMDGDDFWERYVDGRPNS